MKQFDLSVGAITLDPSFTIHQESCESCQKFDAAKPGTATQLCLEGSILWKRDNPTKLPRQAIPRSENYASKDTLRRIMRYK